jgi:hypothetical protein
MMACRGFHQPADYDTMPPRSRDQPGAPNVRRISFRAMLFGVETSSPV